MTESGTTAPRTHYCGQVRESDIDAEITLCGWVNYRRDHGGLIFVDLRDREGLVQIVFDPEALPDALFQASHKLKFEEVLSVTGRVRRRPDGTVNATMATGEIEVLLDGFEILAHAETIPFKVDEHGGANEDLRLKHRYLDLRRPGMQANLIARAKLFRSVRGFLDAQGLVEVETPILTKSTPEGARDFLVPSRVNQGTFYALPQSPQLFKQILMVSGLDRYYQIARCFRDEDLRANRQPEFTQIDIEMSFITPEDIYALSEGMMQTVYRDLKDIEIEVPFPRMTYAESMLRYGSDKPDRRFAMEITDVSSAFETGCDFKVFNSVMEKGGVARAINVTGGAEKFSNTQLKPGGELPEFAARYGAKGLAWFRAEAGEGSGVTLKSTISKFFSAECLQTLATQVNSQPGDLVLIICDKAQQAATALGQVRLYLAKQLGLIDESRLEFCWITDFPFVEWDAENKRWTALHHPFTAPFPEHLDLLETDPGSVLSLAYDLSLNGEEIGGGSIRIHRKDVQQRVFRMLGIEADEANEKFGFLLDALSYGAPPHGGVAYGLDRMMMILQNCDSIRDVIAFPKTQSASCLMTEAPSQVDTKQLRELGIRLTPSVEKKFADAEQSIKSPEAAPSEEAKS